MLVFNEGVPRSGKSYDAVKAHLLPALKSGRVVYARINGLDHEAIADYLDLNVDVVRDLLRLVSTSEVHKTFVAARDASGDWAISANLQNALFIIDECHEFYVASREPINPAIEQFFALCGQNGMDGVLMSQWYRRLHSSVRARIERKNVFQKLTAVGMAGKYTVKRYHTTTPDRFELVGTDTASYDPKIYPLYKGYADGANNTAVYRSGGKTVWSKIGKYAIFVVPAVIAAFFVFHGFFHGTGGLAKKAPPHLVPSSPSAIPPVASLVQSRDLPLSPTMHKTYDTKGMPLGVAYVFSLMSQARPRLAGWIDTSDGHDVGLVEWLTDQGVVLDRLTVDQLRSLGVLVVRHPYGIDIRWRDRAVIVTSWPLDTSTNGPGASSGVPVPSQTLAQAQSLRPDSSRSSTASSALSSVASPDASAWKQNALAHDYVPPGLMPPEVDDFKSSVSSDLH